jgi:CRP/FNR family cyclic AMP-dependent transcriptional regulator
LPRKQVQEFGKRSVVYGPEQPADSLYVVILGRVKITTTAEDGIEKIGRIVCVDGYFGESALVGNARRLESAVALDRVSAMSWTRNEIEMQIDREPHLGIALSQYLVRQCIELQQRIEWMAVCKTPERVMLSLVRLAGTLGTPMPDGSARIEFLTKQTIADYVGTSRAIVSSQMNRLRRLGLLRYSQTRIDINTRAMQETLRKQGISVNLQE